MSVIEDYYAEHEHESKEIDKMFKGHGRKEVKDIPPLKF